MPNLKNIGKLYTFKTERKKSKDFYRSNHWRRLRDSIVLRDKYKCTNCGKRVKQNKGDYAVDHIKPERLFPELRYTSDNLQTLCTKCHAVKSQKETNINSRDDWHKANDRNPD